jgi:general secretion pathway protein H
MRRQYTSMHGFTLLEVMVVLFVIGLLVGMSNLNFTENRVQDDTRRFAQKLQVLMNLYREEAVYRNEDLGLAIDVNEMLLLSYQSPEQLQQKNAAEEKVKFEAGFESEEEKQNPWQPYNNSLFSSPDVIEGITFVLLIEGDEIDFDDFLGDDDEGPKPALMFFSSEDYSPFELVIQHDADQRFEMRLHGDGFNPVWHELIQYED